MTVQCGDVISLDIDDWQVNGRKFNVLSAKYRENSSAAELEIEETSNLIVEVFDDKVS